MMMPELPEVETIKTALAHSIGKCVIKGLTVNNYHLRIPVPQDIAEKIRQQTILEYQRRAKYILIHLSNNLTLIWHMGMSGRIKISDTKPNPPEKHDHIIMETENGWVTYNDARRFGVFTYCETNRLQDHPLLKKTGPEPFDEKMTPDYLYARLQKKNIPIKVALLDQEIVTGIGNIYASETLYLAGIAPTRPAKEISLKECAVLISSFRKVLSDAIAAGGSTLKDYQKPDGSLGYFQNLHCVYNKIGQKCPQCTCDIRQTGGIRKVVLAGRSSFFCPHKQK